MANCTQCIYKANCLCEYQVNSALCMALYQPLSKQMLLRCLSATTDGEKAKELISEYLSGYDSGLLNTGIPLTTEQLQILSEGKHDTQTGYHFLELTKEMELTENEYTVLHGMFLSE